MPNFEVLNSGYWKRRCTFGDIGCHSNPFNPYLECYNHPHLKRTESSLWLTNQSTCVSSWPTVQPSIFAPLGDYPGLSCPLAQLMTTDWLLYHCNASTPSWVVDSCQKQLQRLSISLTNYHQLFWRASSLVTHCLKNFLGAHPSLDYSTTSMFNCKVLKNGLQKRRWTFCDISTPSN